MSYQENILQAVDMVVSQRLGEMSFDKTVVCKVEDDTNAGKGEYTVSYQAMTMVVYAANPEEEYKKGQDVYVTVPQGDFNLRKIIIGYVSPSEIPTYLYTNPMKYLVRLSDNLIADTAILNTENLSAAAINKSIILRDYSKEGNMPPIKYLCFAADFLTSGIIDYTKKYGIKIIGEGTLKEDKELGEKIEWIFDSTQFQGNPYAFNGLFRQEQIFNIERFSELNNLKIELFKEDNDFSVTISNIELVYGYAEEDLTKENIYDKIILYEEEQQTSYSENAILRFNTKVFKNQELTITNNLTYKWFIYHQQAKDVGNGKFWAKIVDTTSAELLSNGNDDYTLKLDENFTIKNYAIPNMEEKALQLMVQVYEGDNLLATSNNLTLLRQDQKDIEGALKGSGIELAAADGGNYFIYDATTHTIINNLNPSTNNMKITAKLTGAAKWTTGSIATWKFPATGTMLESPVLTIQNTLVWNPNYLQEGDTPGEEIKDNEQIYYKANEPVDGWYYLSRAVSGVEAPCQNYRIKDNYDTSLTNNIVQCEITYPNDPEVEPVYAGILLNFGVKGSQGTEYTVAITLDKNYITPDGMITATAHFYDPNGKEIEGEEFYWGWTSQSPTDFLSLVIEGQDKNIYEKTQALIMVDVDTGINTLAKDYYILENNEYTLIAKGTEVDPNAEIAYYKIVDTIQTSKQCIIQSNSNLEEPQMYNYILTATLYNWQLKNGQKINFKAFCPIPLWTGVEETIMYGATMVVYNFQGSNPQLSNTPYSLNDQMATVDILSTDDNIELSNTNTLIVPDLAPTNFPKVTVKLSADRGIWYQPVQLMRNEYSSALLNSWNDNEQFNDGTTILTKMIGAGQKNTEGKFSGVFMGAVGKETEDGMTGLYGYQDGELRFKFTEKGSVYIGTGSDNYISFNEGNDYSENRELVIKTKKFTLNTNSIYLSNIPNDENYLFKLGNKLSFNKNGDLEIDGTITANQGKIATFDLKNGRIFGINQWMLSDTVRVAYTSGMNARYHNDTGNKIFLWAGAIRKWDDPNETGDTWAYDTFGGPDGSYDWTDAYNCITTGFPDATYPTGPASFYVTHTGHLHATDAIISGNITANEGKIANWYITDNAFSQKTSGVTLPDKTIGELTTTFLSGTGQQKVGFKVGDSGYRTDWNIWMGDATINTNWTRPGGKFGVTKDGTLFCKDAKIQGDLEAGTILQDGVQVGSTGNTKFEDWSKYYTRWGRDGKTGGYSQIVVGYHDTGEAPYIELNTKNSSSSFGTMMTLTSDGGAFAGNWNFATSIATELSDIHHKNTITTISDNYSVLFDNLHPVTYKYNDGTSNRLHTGFIAQEVKQALIQANISSQDFAGLVIYNRDTEEELWTLRYGEFIALNTWQIQKLKTRVSELETELAEIKEKLK